MMKRTNEIIEIIMSIERIIVLLLICPSFVHVSRNSDKHLDNEYNYYDDTGYGYRRQQNMFYNLTQPENYQSWIRPMGNCHGERSSQDGLHVNISIELYNYATIHEQTSEYTFQFFLDLNWCDERLIGDFNSFPKGDNNIGDGDEEREELYNLLEGSTFHIDRIWRPHIFVPNNEQPGTIDNDIVSSNSLRVDLKTGRVWLRKRKMLNVNCKMDFSFFPFDQQECHVHFQASVDNVRNLKLRWGDTIRVKDPTDQRTPEPEMVAEAMNWAVYRHSSFRTMGFRLPDESIRLTNSQSLGISGLNFSRCTFNFVLEREFTHYLITAYFPSALIVVVSWCEFWLEITSPPARVMLGVTTMLALLTSFKSAKEQLSSISYINVMDVWNFVCTTFIVLILMEFAMVNYIYNTRKRSDINESLKRDMDDYKRVQESRSRTATMSHGVQMEPLSQQQSFDDDSTDTPEVKTKFQYNNLKDLLLKAFSNKRCFKRRDIDPDQVSVKSRTSSVSFVLPSTANNANNNNSNNMSSIRENCSTEFVPSRNTNISGAHPRRAILYNRQNTMSGLNSGPNSRRASRTTSVAFAKEADRRKSVFISRDVEKEARFNLTPEQLALSIDRLCRYIFPLAFLLFNICYWMVIFTRSKKVY